MAARGSEAKNIITQKILEMFDSSFIYDKEIRIPIEEGSETVQIKCVLTCAKVNVSNGEDTAVPGPAPTPVATQSSELTEQEKKDTADLLASLDL